MRKRSFAIALVIALCGIATAPGPSAEARLFPDHGGGANTAVRVHARRPHRCRHQEIPQRTRTISLRHFRHS